MLGPFYYVNGVLSCKENVYFMLILECNVCKVKINASSCSQKD